MRRLYLSIVILVMLALPAQATEAIIWEGWVGDVYIEVTTGLTAQVVRPPSWEGHNSSIAEIPETVRIVDNVAITAYDVPVTIIKNDAFRDHDLWRVTLCRNLKVIESDAFAGCTGIYEVRFNCENMDQMARSMFPHPVSVFYDSRESLRNIIIGPHVKKIPFRAFSHLDHLSEVTIPSSVEDISAYAFKGCSKLVLLEMESATPPAMGFGAFDDQTVMYLHVPEGATLYYAYPDWSSFNIYEGNDHPVAVTYQGTELYYRLDSQRHTATVVCPYIVGGWFRLLAKPHGAVVIPDQVNYQGSIYNVTGVDVRALGDCPDLTSITIGRNITFIHHDAFWDSQNINTVYYNAIQCEDMPLRTSAFYPSEGTLEHLIIGDEVTQIPAYAFYDCNLIGEIAFPSSLNKIGVEAFKGCSSLEGEFSFPYGFVMGKEAFMNCKQLTQVNIGMVSVPEGAFYGCSGLSSLTFGSTVKTIGADAFHGCTGLLALELPNALETIGSAAFDGCSGVSGNLVLPPYLQEIGDRAFRNCQQVTSVNFPSLLTSIGDGAFKNCTGLPGDLVLPNTLQTIGESAFEGCTGFSSVSVNVTVLNANTFKGCTGLTEVTIGQNVTEIACNTFENCNQIATVNFNATNCLTIRFFDTFYTYERYSPFRDSRETLTTLNLAAGVTCIPLCAFYQCYHLSDLNLPASVNRIEGCAFLGCSSLTGALNLPVMNVLGYGAFKGCTGLTSVSVDVPTISEQAFKGCTGLTEVTIGQSVTEIQIMAFEDCNHIATVNFNALDCTYMGSAHSASRVSPFDSSSEVLQTLNIGSSVNRIPAYAFHHCINLLKPVFPASLKFIEQDAFARCNSIIGSLELTGLEELRFDAFYKCIALTSVSVDVPAISEGAFMGCTDLTEVTIGQHVKEIKKNAFKDCTNIITVNFNATNCTKMDFNLSSAFCSIGENFTTLNIGSGVVRIPTYAFKDCSSLNTINVSATTPPVLFGSSFDYSTHTLLRVPQESYSLYRDHEYWGRFMLGSDLVIAGVEVTEDNAANITAAGITSGTVSYSFETHTLTLNGATITMSEALSLESWVDSLHIKLIGNNSIATTSEQYPYYYEDAILLHGATVLEGTGTLNVSAAKRAIYMTNSLALEGGCSLNITSNSGYPCIQGVNGTTLTIDGSQLSTPERNHNNGTMIGFDDVIMVNSVVSEPEGAVYDPVDRCFKDAEQNMVIGRIVIDNPAFDLWVAGTRVTEYNKDDVLGDGAVSYHKDTHTLILHDADLSVSHGEALRSELDDLVVNLAGSNTLTSSSGTALVSTGNLSFVGSGILTAEGHLHGIRTNGNLTMDGGCDVTVRSYCSGEYGAVVGDPNKTLIVNTARLYAEAPYSNRSAIAGFRDVVIDFSTVRFDQPAFTITWNSTDHCYEYMEDNQTIRYKGVIDIVYRAIGLTVAGVPVTLDNAADVLGNGKVSFDPVYKRLTLNEASLSGRTTYGIESHLRDLRIALVGSNSVSSSVTAAIYADQPFSIEGNGSLSAQGACGIHADSCDLTIGGGCSVIASGSTQPGLYGDAAHSLTIGPGTLVANTQSQQNTAIAGFGTLDLDEMSFVFPANGSYADGQVNDANGDAYYAQVRFYPVEYNLEVRGVRINALTASDVLDDGTVNYDASNKVLTLNGVTLNAEGNLGITNYIEGLKIVVVGDDNRIQSNLQGIYSNKDFTIEGNGTLTTQGGSSGINAYSCNLTIGDGCTVVAESTVAGNNAGIHGSNGKTLTLRRCKVTAKVASSNTMTAIYGFGTLNLEDTQMSQPSGGSYRNLEVYNTWGNVYYGNVEITPTPYELWVGEEQVDPVSARDVLGDGTVSYDAVRNELTLNGAEIYMQGDPGIESWIEGLKIILVGNDNYIEADYGIHSKANFTIGGSGSITIVGDGGINAEGCDLTITDGCTVNVKGRGNESYHTALHGDTGHTLTVDRSTVIARSSVTSPSYSAINGFDTLNMVGVTMDPPGIYQPEGVMVGFLYYGDVVIAPMAYPLWIAGVQVTSANADNFTDYVERGSVHYDADSYELYLNNATLRYGESGFPVIYSNALHDLSINLTGDNYLVGSESESCIALELQSTGDDNQINIFGPGTLTTNADMKLGGLWTVYLDDCSLNIGGEGSLYTLGDTINGFDLELVHALLTASSVYGMGYYGGVIDGAEIMQPERAYVDDQDRAIYVDEHLAHEVVIGCEYDLRVADIQVTSLNASHITGEGIEGHVSYDASNKVLTLENATITTTNSEGIYNFASVSTDFSINLVGHNTIISQGYDAIFTSPATTIIGEGDLVVSGTHGINCQSHLTLQGGTLEAIGMGYAGLLGQNGKTLTVASPATLRAYIDGSGEESSIEGFGQLVMTGEEVLQPLGGHYNATLHRFEDAEGERYSDLVEISYVVYDLWLGSTRVTSANANDLSNVAGVTAGAVSYDKITHTLTLNGATLNFATDADGITSHINGLSIQLVGNNTLSAGANGIVIEQANTTIKGNGSLGITLTGEGVGIKGTNMDGRILTMEDAGCTVSIDASGNMGLVTDGILRVNRATLDITSNTATLRADDVMFDYVSISTPEGAWFDAESHRVNNVDGDELSGRIVIEPTQYELYVAGTQVTGLNVNDVLGDGTISYDAMENTLTLNEATIPQNGDNSGIITGIESLSIILVGENKIYTNDFGIEIQNVNTTITGTGKLQIYSTGDKCIVADGGMADKTLTISGGCIVILEEAPEGGIYLDEGNLAVDRSTLEIKSEDEGMTLLYANALDMCGTTYISIPEGGYFYGDVIMNSDGTPSGSHAKIEPLKYQLYVAGTQVDAINAVDVFGDGKVRYDETENTLTLNEASIFNEEEDYGIKSYIDSLNIVLEGVNYINAYEEGLSLYADAAISGPGRLEINSGGYGVYGNNSTSLKLDEGCSVSIEASSGIYLSDGQSGMGSVLTVENSTLEIETNHGETPAVTCLELNLRHTGIAVPAGASFENNTIVNAEDVPASHIVIVPAYYDLYVAGTQVTALNANDVLGDGGTVRYDIDNTTLTLDGAYLSYQGTEKDGCIDNGIANLKIALVGMNDIVSSKPGIYSDADGTTIQGDGMLTVRSQKDGIYLTGSGLTLEGGCQVDVASTGSDNPAAIYCDSPKELRVDWSTLRALSPSTRYSAVNGFAGLVLEGTEIVTPQNGYYLGGEIYNGNHQKHYGLAVIEPCNVFTGADDDDWNNEANWSKNQLPDAFDKVYVDHYCVMNADVDVRAIVVNAADTLEVKSDVILTTQAISTARVDNFVINDGAQVICNSANTLATMHKYIGRTDGDNFGWYLIAVPMNDPTIEGHDVNIYDIYAYDEDADQNEWQNYRVSSFDFEPGRGYLYANNANMEMLMSGSLVPSDAVLTIDLSYAAINDDIRGFNLIGNPYPRNLSMSEMKINGQPVTEYYRLVQTVDGTTYELCTEGDILPGEAFFIKATADGQTLTIGRRVR